VSKSDKTIEYLHDRFDDVDVGFNGHVTTYEVTENGQSITVVHDDRYGTWKSVLGGGEHDGVESACDGILEAAEAVRGKGGDQ